MKPKDVPKILYYKKNNYKSVYVLKTYILKLHVFHIFLHVIVYMKNSLKKCYMYY